MFKRISIVLAIVLVLSLASGPWVSASAESPQVPFKAYYPTIAVMTGGPLCMQQEFTPGGDGLASHMGVSQFSGEATFCVFPPPPTQKGVGTLTAANGDSLTVYYEGTLSVIDGVRVTDGTYVVTGGSGRFWGVTGGGKYHVVVNNDPTQPNDLTFEGHLHNP